MFYCCLDAEIKTCERGQNGEDSGRFEGGTRWKWRGRGCEEMNRCTNQSKDNRIYRGKRRIGRRKIDGERKW